MSTENDKFNIEAFLNHRPDVRKEIEAMIKNGRAENEEEAFKQIIERDLQDFLHCPVCTGDISLRGLPIIEAEKQRYVQPMDKWSRE